MSLLPAKPATTSIALPDIAPITAPMLAELTKALGVGRNILPADDQISHVWSNLPRLIAKIPPEHRSETIVRMCVAVASGLFDSAINYAWNAAIAYRLKLAPNMITGLLSPRSDRRRGPATIRGAEHG